MQIIEKVRKFVKKNRKMEFLWKCFINRDNNDFITLVLDWAESPYNIQVHHYGEKNMGKIIYAITEVGNNWGFFAEFRWLLVSLLYAERMGMIPIIYYGEHFLYYEMDGVRGEKNAFQYYFEQAMSDDDIYKSANVVWSNMKHPHYIEEEYGNKGYLVREKFINDLSEIFRKYIHFNDETMAFLKKTSSTLLQRRKILGIHYRGTDFKKEYKNHPVMVTMEQIIREVQKCFATNSYEAIFLATDDKDILEVVQEAFGDKLLYYNDTYRGEGDVSVAFSSDDRENHKYRLGLEVLRDVYTLSQCEGLVCGLSQVSLMACVFKKSYQKEYEDYVLIDNGICANTEQFNPK